MLQARAYLERNVFANDATSLHLVTYADLPTAIKPTCSQAN